MDEYDVPKPVPARPDPGRQWPTPSAPTYGAGYDPGLRPTQQLPVTPSPDWTNSRRNEQSSRPLRPLRSHRSASTGSPGRTIVAAVLATIGCLAGSLALTAFVISTIALNPERPGDIVKAALSTPAGRTVAADALAAALRSADPSLTSAQASSDATTIVNSPALATSLGSSKGDVSAALLAQLKKVNPAAAAQISAHHPAGTTATTTAPGTPTLSALPSGVLTATSKAHSALRTAQRYLLIIAIIGIGASLLISPRRGAILVRVGWWALGASLIQLVVWLGLPKLLGHFHNPWTQVAAAALRADGDGLLTVFVVLAAGGAAFVLLGLASRLVVGLARSM